MDLIVFRHFSSFLPHLHLPVPVPLLYLLTKARYLAGTYPKRIRPLYYVYCIVNAHYTSILYSYTLRR